MYSLIRGPLHFSFVPGCCIRLWVYYPYAIIPCILDYPVAISETEVVFLVRFQDHNIDAFLKVPREQCKLPWYTICWLSQRRYWKITGDFLRGRRAFPSLLFYLCRRNMAFTEHTEFFIEGVHRPQAIGKLLQIANGEPIVNVSHLIYGIVSVMLITGLIGV